MPNEKLYIKNMVCDRCKKTVTKVLCDLGIEHKPVSLGEVTLLKPLDTSVKKELEDKLLAEGFEIIDNRKIPSD